MPKNLLETSDSVLPNAPACTVSHNHLWEVSEELPRLHRQRRRKLHDILKGNITFTALHPSYIVPVQAGTFGKFFLRQATFVAESADRRPEPQLDGRSRHSSIVRS